MVKFNQYEAAVLRRDMTAHDGTVYKQGTLGIIVEIYGDHEAYEFDVAEPPYNCFTVKPDDIAQY